MKQIGGNAIVIKEVNVNFVRKALKTQGRATKQQLAQATGLSIVTVGTVLRLLLLEGEVLEGEPISSSGGRPARQYEYNAEYALALLLFPHESNGTIKARSTVVNLMGALVFETDEPVETIDMPTLERIIDERIASYPSMRAIGLGLPGAEYDGKMIVSDYEALLGVSVTEHLRTRYGKPVIMENDVNAAVIGYGERTGAGEQSTIVYLFFPERYPPGAGILIQGKLYKGRGHYAGEVANIPLGVSWGDASLMNSFDELCEAIAKLTVAVSSVLDPNVVVLHGRLISQEHLCSIADKCGARLPKTAVPAIMLSNDFEADYLNGLIALTLATLEPTIVLSRK
ncbi:ROK family protein [Cohnella faecalis]|uniref:ROK family protein n=1 Tax=Cohnella faecalis TaxID=2315694 RepID=A0A398CRE8_9BACL|nr:ROK family protein [Cohnella faecalis]RIE05113.1 ROK family protein [Cohnella faecalis]